MSEKSTDPRVTEARKKYDAAKEKLDDAENELLKSYGDVLRERGLDPDNTVVPGSWDCEESPVGKCVYDFYEDPARDCCLFCGDPEERK